jgi:hypothetical protein
VHAGVDDGDAPRHVADMLIANLTEAIEARAEIVTASECPEGAVSVATLRVVGPNALRDERCQLAGAWAEGGEDARGLAERTKHLADLEDLLALASITVTA